MKKISVDHGNNKLILVKNKNIKLTIEGSDKKAYRVGFYELEDFEGKPTSLPIYSSDAIYVGWHCSETCELHKYPNKILINMRSEMGWFADVVYDNIKDKFYRINNIRDIEILNKVGDPILITGSYGGGTSYITKILLINETYYVYKYFNLIKRIGRL